VSLGYGVLESNVPQRMAGFGLSPEVGGWFLALLATGSCIGGTLASIRPTSRKRPRVSAAVLSFAFAILIVPEALARTPALYGPALVLATLSFVPMVGLLAAEFEARLGSSQRGEGFAYFVTALTLGGSCGYLCNGLLIGPLAASTLPWLSTVVFVAVGLALCLGRPPGRRLRARQQAGAGLAAVVTTGPSGDQSAVARTAGQQQMEGER
jgi:predicted MFS family arabinose efflux permease